MRSVQITQRERRGDASKTKAVPVLWDKANLPMAEGENTRIRVGIYRLLELWGEGANNS